MVNASQHARLLASCGPDTTSLYDLAYYLTDDTREAAALLADAIDSRGDGALDSGEDACRRLVRAYLARGHLHRASRLVRRLGRLVKGADRPEPALHAALQWLSPSERVCLLLRERQGHSVAEIAAITGLSEAQTRLDLFGGRERLCAALAPMGQGRETRRVADGPAQMCRTRG